MAEALRFTGNLAFNLIAAVFASALLLGGLAFCFTVIALITAFAAIAAPVLLLGWAITDALGAVW